MFSWCHSKYGNYADSKDFRACTYLIYFHVMCFVLGKGFLVDAMPKALRKQSAEAAEQAKKEAEKREKAGMHRSIRVTQLYQIVSNSTTDFKI